MEIYIDPQETESTRNWHTQLAQELTLSKLEAIYLEEWNKAINAQIQFLEQEVFNSLSPKRKVQWLKIKLNEEVLEQRRINNEIQDAYFRGLFLQYSEDRKTKLQRAIRILEVKPTADGITPENVERAREVPITDWLTFGRDKKTICLWHTDTRPSLHYYKTSNRVKCFSCDVRKDVISVVMALRGVDFIEAVKVLNS